MAKQDGELIKIVFSDDIISGFDGTTLASHFSIDFYVPEYAPDGQLVSQTNTPILVYMDGTDAIVLQFQSGNVNCFRNAVGNIIVHYDGIGDLKGEGGYVSAFNWEFTPQDLLPKLNQHERENITVDITADSNLFDITWRYGYETDNVAVNILATGVLTKVEDL